MSRDLHEVAKETLVWLMLAQSGAADHNQGWGGISAWNKDGVWAAPYPEVSGYLIPTLIKWGQVRSAQEVANWLLTKQLPSGAFPDLKGEPTLFDSAAVAEGLRSIYGLMLEHKYFVALDKLATWAESVPEMSWDFPLYNTRAAAVWEMEFTWSWDTPMRSHYLGYWLEALYRAYEEEEVRAALEDLVVPADNLLYFEYEPGWIATTQRKDLCATLQVAALFHLLGDRDKARLMISSVVEHVRPDGGVPLDPAHPEEAFSWCAKFLLDAIWLVLYT